VSPVVAVTDLIEPLRALEREAAALSCVPSAAEMARRLTRLDIEVSLDVEAARPVVVSLLGGTGVGKSQLFNALIGRNDASPVSSDVRAFTTCPHIAAAERLHRQLRTSSLGNPDAKLLAVDQLEIALVDTPDVDSVSTSNQAVTRRVIEQSDVVVYVTTHEKLSAHDLVAEVLRWGPLKRWLFVMNKADLEGDCGTLLREFDGHLERLGFPVGPSSRFMVSATCPDCFDFARLRRTILGEHIDAQVQALRLSNFLGSARDAVAEPLSDDVAQMARKLELTESGLNEELCASYRKSLRAPLAVDALRHIVRARAWRNLAGRVGGFMGLPVWVRGRISTVSTSVRVSQLALRGLGVLGLLGVGMSALTAVLRELLPLRQVIAMLGPEHRKLVERIGLDSLNVLRDHGIELALAAPAAAEPAPAGRRASRFVTNLLDAGDLLRRRLGIGVTDPVDEQMLNYLQQDLDYLALGAANRVATPVRSVLANALPMVFSLHAVYRVADAWFRAEYLPVAFYAMALGLLAAALVPGYLLYTAEIRAQVDLSELDSLEAPLAEPAVTEPLRLARRRLERLVTDALALRAQLDRARVALEDALGSDAVGVPLSKWPTPRFPTSPPAASAVEVGSG
jgi:hypothetical protein